MGFRVELQLKIGVSLLGSRELGEWTFFNLFTPNRETTPTFKTFPKLKARVFS